jgi:hypothetical protein
MHTVEIKGEITSFASSLEELSKADYIYLLTLVAMEKSGEITVDEFLTFFTVRLLHIKRTVKYILMSDEKKAIIHDHIRMLAEMLDSFFIAKLEDGIEKKVLQLETIKNLIPDYRGLIGPADALTNCNFFEYKEAYNHYLLYTKDNQISELDALIAILYRPKVSFRAIRNLYPKFDGRSRISFTTDSNPLLLVNRTKKVSKWPYAVKFGIFLWFSSCVKFLREGKPVIDGIEIDLSILYSKEIEVGPSGIGLTGLLYSLAESKVFGNINETANANLFDVMARLYQVKAEYDRQILRMKKS